MEKKSKNIIILIIVLILLVIITLVLIFTNSAKSLVAKLIGEKNVDIKASKTEEIEEVENNSEVDNQNITSQVKPGDIIYYNPVFGVKDQSKLTYTVKVGSSKTPNDPESKTTAGSGFHKEVTFTAKLEDDRWIVLKNENGTLTLMLTLPKERDNIDPENLNDKGLMFRKPTGYLHAEQELHNICSIFGYGKGAVEQVSYIVEPKIGSPDVEGDLKDATLIKSGARSATRYDIEELAGIKTKEDKMSVNVIPKNKTNKFTEEFKVNFMTRNLPQINTHIPVLDDRGTVSGSNFRTLYTNYYMAKDKIKISDKLKQHIFNPGYDIEVTEDLTPYWLASRSVYSGTESYQGDDDTVKGYTKYCVDVVSKDSIFGMPICVYTGESNESMSEIVDISNYTVRPIVQLRPDVNLKNQHKLYLIGK